MSDEDLWKEVRELADMVLLLRKRVIALERKVEELANGKK